MATICRWMTGYGPKKLKSITVRTPSGKVLSINPHPGTGLQSHMVSYEKPGTYVLSAETNPGFYTVYLDKKGRKRHAIKPKSDIMDKAQKVTKSLLSRQFGKTYVVCGTPSVEFPARIGQKLELVPTGDITKLKAGGTLELEVFFNGKSYQGPGTWDASYNGFSTEAEDNFYPKTEIKGSTLKIFIPQPGRWFVRYYIKSAARGVDKERCNKLKDTATLVFQIDNARKRPKSSSH